MKSQHEDQLRLDIWLLPFNAPQLAAGLLPNSDEDYRCYMAEGLQMFTALRYHGVESRLVLFHGENHNLSRTGKPHHRLGQLREIVSWFDQYLKDPQSYP